MDCYVPGQIILSPGPEWRDERARGLGEVIGVPLDIRHDVTDILRAHDLASEKMSGGLPVVVRVPEGLEQKAAALSSREGRSRNLVGAAVPDYLVRPSSAITVDDQVISDAIASAHASPRSPTCGRGCTVGIIDSGINDALLPAPASLDPRRLSACDPLSHTGATQDLTGHGSLVGHIINRIAPSARLISVKAFDRSGSLSNVLAALYLANAAGPCDIINLSLMMSCDAEHCAVCSAPASTSMTLNQLKFFFDAFRAHAPQTLLVAAAGNNTAHLGTPAAFEGVLAVGSYHFRTGEVLSAYKAVPIDRFILAPDGTPTLGEALAHRPGHRMLEPMFGTSFAAAFATGVAARLSCASKGGPCDPVRQGSMNGPTGLLAAFAANADRHWKEFDPAVHGLGRLRL